MQAPNPDATPFYPSFATEYNVTPPPPPPPLPTIQSQSCIRKAITIHPATKQSESFSTWLRSIEEEDLEEQVPIYCIGILASSNVQRSRTLKWIQNSFLSHLSPVEWEERYSTSSFGDALCVNISLYFDVTTRIGYFVGFSSNSESEKALLWNYLLELCHHVFVLDLYPPSPQLARTLRATSKIKSQVRSSVLSVFGKNAMPMMLNSSIPTISFIVPLPKHHISSNNNDSSKRKGAYRKTIESQVSMLLKPLRAGNTTNAIICRAGFSEQRGSSRNKHVGTVVAAIDLPNSVFILESSEIATQESCVASKLLMMMVDNNSTIKVPPPEEEFKIYETTPLPPLAKFVLKNATSFRKNCGGAVNKQSSPNRRLSLLLQSAISLKALVFNEYLQQMTFEITRTDDLKDHVEIIESIATKATDVDSLYSQIHAEAELDRALGNSYGYNLPEKYGKRHHTERTENALREFKRYVGPLIPNYEAHLNQLRTACDSLWTEEKRVCDALSCDSKRPCIKPCHTKDDDHHSTGFYQVLWCNCGRTKKSEVPDSFDLKTANYSKFISPCCVNLIHSTINEPMWSLASVGNHFSYDSVTGLLFDGFIKQHNKLQQWKYYDQKATIFVGLEYACIKFGHRFIIHAPPPKTQNDTEKCIWPSSDTPMRRRCLGCLSKESDTTRHNQRRRHTSSPKQRNSSSPPGRGRSASPTLTLCMANLMRIFIAIPREADFKNFQVQVRGRIKYSKYANDMPKTVFYTDDVCEAGSYVGFLPKDNLLCMRLPQAFGGFGNDNDDDAISVEVPQDESSVLLLKKGVFRIIKV